MMHLNEVDAVREVFQRADESVDAVAGVTVDALHAPIDEPLQKKTACILPCHRSLRTL
jgi:hypothetical protein